LKLYAFKFVNLFPFEFLDLVCYLAIPLMATVPFKSLIPLEIIANVRTWEYVSLLPQVPGR
jgi:hypothetical protein